MKIVNIKILMKKKDLKSLSLRNDDQPIKSRNPYIKETRASKYTEIVLFFLGSGLHPYGIGVCRKRSNF
jgi:hypothetical protein